ncbi:MAG: DUF2752 domain-containing protein [Clostridium sp.]|nr:DUF2752 domain-containing protein [Clostridium sp.]
MFYLIGWIALPTCILAVVFIPALQSRGFTFPPCGWDYHFRIYCPGCGGTRSVLALFHGNLLQSFLYYPAVPFMAVLYLVFMISHTMERFVKTSHVHGIKYHNWYVCVLMGLVFINCIVRNILRLRFGIQM